LDILYIKCLTLTSDSVVLQFSIKDNSHTLLTLLSVLKEEQEVKLDFGGLKSLLSDIVWEGGDID